MRKLIGLAAVLLLVLPLLGADNYTVTDRTGAAITIRSLDTGSGIESPQVTVQDANNVRLISCNLKARAHVTSATDTVLVQGVTSQVIYICGYTMWAAGTNTVYLENTASTNNNCSSTLTQIDNAYAFTAQSGVVDSSPFFRGLKNTSGNGLCVNSSATGAVDVQVFYAQF